MADSTERVDLSEFQEGGYAVLRTRLTWGAAKRMGQAQLAGMDAVDAMLAALVCEWHVMGNEGEPLPLPRDLPPGALDELDATIVAKVSTAAQAIAGRITGKATTGEASSSESSQETAT